MNDQEIKIDYSEELTLKQTLKQACKKLGCKDDYHRAKLYTKEGVRILDTDFGLIHSGDVLYISPKGKSTPSNNNFRRKFQLLRHPGRLRFGKDSGSGRVRQSAAGAT